MEDKNILIFLFLIVLLTSFLFAAPGAPTGLRFEQNTTSNYDEGTFTLNWTAGTGDVAANYSVYIGVGGTLFKKDTNNSATGYSYTNTTEGNYTFQVAGVNATGDEGTNSSIIYMNIDTTAPISPTALVFGRNTTATSDIEGEFSVNWTAGGNLEKNYSVYISINGGTSWFKKDTNSSAIGYSYTNTTEANYTFQIAGVDLLGREGTNSSIIYMNVDLPYPTAPTGLTFGRNSSAAYDEGTFTLNWTAGAGGDAVKNYSIYISVGGTLFNKSVNNSVTGYTYTNTTAGNYTFKVAGVNVTGTEGTNSSNIPMYIDRTEPVVTLVSPADEATNSTTSQQFRFKVTDNLNIKNCLLYIDDELDQTETSVSNNTNTYFDNSVTLSRATHEWYVKCYDYAGNSDESGIWELTITTSSSSSSSSDSTDFWIETYSPSSTSLSAGYTKELSAKEKIKFPAGGASNHSVGVISLTSTTAKVNVSSSPQQKTLAIGGEWKVEVTGDGYYDVFVKLNNISNSKANLTIRTIREEIPAEDLPPLSSNSTEENDSSDNETGGASGNTVGEGAWFILILIVVSVLVLVVVYFFQRRKKFGY